MIPLKSLFVALALASSLLASAIPVKVGVEQTLPSGGTIVALDEDLGLIRVFDHNLKQLSTIPLNKANSGKRDVGSCTALSTAEAQSLPGWAKLQAAAKANWGSGSYNLVTNPPDIPGYNANSCVQTEAIQISPDTTSLSCQTTTQTTGGTLVGTSGTVQLQSSQGTTYSLQNQVTNTASLSVGESVSVKITFPDIAEVTASETVTGTYTNTQSVTTTATTSNTNTATVTMNAPVGQTCSLSFTNKACSESGTGQVAFTASGYVWFEYNSETNGHYKWGLSIDSTLPDAADKSSYSTFRTAISSTTTSAYEGKCQ